MVHRTRPKAKNLPTPQPRRKKVGAFVHGVPGDYHIGLPDPVEKIITTRVKRMPKDVLWHQMEHFEEKAEALTRKLDAMEAKGTNGTKFDKLETRMLTARKFCIEAAKTLAPYVHPRLSAVLVKTDDDTRFVMRLPQVAHTADEWEKHALKERFNRPEQDAVLATVDEDE